MEAVVVLVVGVMVAVESMVLLEVCIIPLEGMEVGALQAMAVLCTVVAWVAS